MKYISHIHHRRSMRLKGYNYAQAGSYFVTINCHNRIPLFGEIRDRKMFLNDFGLIAFKEWQRTPVIRPNIELGVFIIMPDHIHGIIIIREDVSGWIDSNFSDRFSDRGGCNTPRAEDTDWGVLHPPQSKDENQSELHPPQSKDEDWGVLHPPQSADENQNEIDSPLSVDENQNELHPPQSKSESRQSFLSPSQTLGAILRGYMGTVTSQINKLRNTPGDKVWQRNYHDHIIRNKWSFHRISRYIKNNPLHWENDKLKL